MKSKYATNPFKKIFNTLGKNQRDIQLENSHVNWV